MTAPPSEPILHRDGVTVSFDGFKALDGLSLVVEPGELRSIIGPNGAGKTTMMDVITGRTRPDSGTVAFKGSADLTRLSEARIARLGIGRKFQKPSVFESLTVEDNLELALRNDRRLSTTLRARIGIDERRRIDEVLELTGLEDARLRIAGTLAHGQKQWLEIGMLLMQDPELLLVDEPVAGMTDHETEATAVLLRRIAGSRSVVVVEHDMDFVRALATRVTVLHEGRVLAEGSQPSIIKEIERVVRRLAESGRMAIPLVEQYWEFARDLAHDHAVMSRGEIVLAGSRADMIQADVRRHLTV